MTFGNAPCSFFTCTGVLNGFHTVLPTTKENEERKVRASLGHVAVKNMVCRLFGTCCRIFWIWGSKPMSSIRSASSSTFHPAKPHWLHMRREKGEKTESVRTSCKFPYSVDLGAKALLESSLQVICAKQPHLNLSTINEII